jgi:hypothetical protein
MPDGQLSKRAGRGREEPALDGGGVRIPSCYPLLIPSVSDRDAGGARRQDPAMHFVVQPDLEDYASEE